MCPDNVKSIIERQPHLVVSDSTGDAHVLPIPFIRDIAAGRIDADCKVAELLAIALLDSHYGD
jgi:hypothetical protein